MFHPDNAGPWPMVMELGTFREVFPGEGEHVELKQGISVTRVQEVAVAFSNTDGGVLIAGVSPQGELVGITQPGEKAKDLHQAFRDAQNPGRYEVHELHVDGKVLLAVGVARRHEGFAQTSGGVVLVRRGASNVPLLGPDLSRFLARRTFTSFELTATDVPLDESDPSLRKRLCASFDWHEDEHLARRLHEAGFAETDRTGTVLTVAGALLLLTDPRRIGGRPHIEIRRYAEGEPDPDKVWQIRGPVDRQIEQTTSDLVAELGSISAIVGTHRIEMPRLPTRALREAVANAVAHRSYEHAGTAIHIDVHPTHVTITSPGSLPEPVTIENIRFQQAARNDRLLGALRRLGLAEDLGKGIDRIEDDMAAELLQPPDFSTDGSFFSVTLGLGGAVTPRERAWVRGLIAEAHLDPRAALVVVTVAREGSTTNSSVRSLLDVDSVRARAILQDLVREGVLVQLGQRGGAEYQIAPSVGIPARIRHTDAELEALALDLARHQPLTNALLRQESGLDRLQALNVLRRLVDRGALVQRGQRRGTRYELPN
ncbi:MAG: putative DNA binding domain-containing protein [Acidimicrobiia bacterium]|nr:putative DNA binding domain-containing protein [Acidimicrobiia bacterium]